VIKRRRSTGLNLKPKEETTMTGKKMKDKKSKKSKGKKKSKEMY
jgi:hypothetical protein